MFKLLVPALALTLAALAAACAPAPLLPAEIIPTLPPLPSLVPPATATTAPTQGATTTVTSAAALTSAATNGALTQTLTARITVTATTAITTPRPVGTIGPTASPTFSTAGIPPGVYVTDIKIEPNPPTRSADLIFSPTFVNTFNTVQNYRWIVYIYKQDNPARSTGETTFAQTAIPVGISDQKPGGTWKYGPGNQCEFLFLQVGWQDQDRKTIFFARTDGKIFQKNLTLCP